ncbi:DUF739 domain-containing protein [Leptotrichia sp. OH3620_COT-345]|uniref:DUF739 domain-containing protein n=1 Tax=Leptotrichia sp. OH3620_COT-345 TaxID=2491048 RepID=UPI000F651943|nr:DUF739 domain-containing protein [Leptotrichia sp. OH3620_COT-345]RRD39293.1 DUF739 domain-containing protein [Leptotrichia sp. OH3620_COT-345]
MNADKLKGKIKEKRFNYKTLANKIGIGETSMTQKLNKKQPLLLREVKRLRKILNLDDKETIEIFFN